MSEFGPTIEYREVSATATASRSCLRATVEVALLADADTSVLEIAESELDRSVTGETRLGSALFVRLKCGITACDAACMITDAYAGQATVRPLLAPGRERSLDDCIQE